MKRLPLLIAVCALLSFACAYIVVPADLLATPTAVVASRDWTGLVTNVGKSSAGDLHVDLAIRNDTQDWSAMQASQGQPAVLTTHDGKTTNCDTVFVGTGGTRLAPGFQMRGYATGPQATPTIQLLYVECKGATASPGETLSIGYSYITGPYDLHVPSVPVTDTMQLNLDQVAKNVKYPVATPVGGPPTPVPGSATPVAGAIAKIGDKIIGINMFTVTLTAAKRTAKGLELDWEDYNPTDYPNYIHIGTPPVIGDDGILYGPYQDPAISEPAMTDTKQTADWTTSVEVPNNVKGLYVLVSIETRQMDYFVSHVIDITDK